MKQYSFFAVVLAIMLSCKNENPETTTTVVSEDSLHIGEKNMPTVEMWDSIIFHIGNREFEISTSSEHEFDAVADPFNVKDTSEVIRIKKAAPAVSRSGDSLIFKSSNSKVAYLINNDNGDDVDNYAVYSFIQDMSKINQWLVMASYYESYGYIFIDKTSGDSTMLYGMPVVSPDNKYILTFNQDLEAGFTYNGFQLFEMNGSKPVAAGTKELISWGPDNVKWKNSNTLLVQQSTIKPDSSNGGQQLVTEYVQIKMK